jgi:hypothetical protein
VEVRANDYYMPRGVREPREARIESFCNEAFMPRELRQALREWWLCHPRGANTPNWDLAATCSIEGADGLLLCEAKANTPELSPAGKRLATRSRRPGPPPEPSVRSKANHRQIAQAIAEAGAALRALGVVRELSIDSHYQLANRLAFTWKLASLGIPVALLYLGFWGDQGIRDVGAPFTSADDWQRVFSSYASGVLTNPGQDARFAVGNVPALMLVRARKAESQSPVVAS